MYAPLLAPLPLYFSHFSSPSFLFFSSHINSKPVTQYLFSKSMCIVFLCMYITGTATFRSVEPKAQIITRLFLFTAETVCEKWIVKNRKCGTHREIQTK